MRTPNSIEMDIDAMESAAFDALAKRHPECKTGDLDPMLVANLRSVMQLLKPVVIGWLTANAAWEG